MRREYTKCTVLLSTRQRQKKYSTSDSTGHYNAILGIKNITHKKYTILGSFMATLLLNMQLEHEI